MKCQICQKTTSKGRRVTYSKKRSIRRFKPNIQKVLVFYKGKWQRLEVCTKCRKKISKTKF